MANKTIEVVATATGFYGHIREPGDKFTVTVHDDDPAEGQAKWYREVDKKGDVKLTTDEKKNPETAPVIPSSPFTPQPQTYKAKHLSGGNFIVVDAEGTQVGDVFKKVPGNQLAAKTSAQEAADSMNKVDPVAGAPISPTQAAQVQTQTALSQDPALNVQADEDDDGHPDA